MCHSDKEKIENYKEQSKILTSKNITLNTESYEVYVDNLKVSLTVKEYDILKLLLENQNKVFTRENLLNSIWGYDFYGNAKVVDAHIKKIRKKLGYNCIETVRGIGYRI